MPKVFAFEIETNLRSLIEEVLEPIVLINKSNNTRIGHLEKVTKELDLENQNISMKLDSDT